MKSIKLSKDTYMHTYLHEIPLTLEEMISHAEDSSSNFISVDFKESARELIDGMEDHWCVALLEAIKNECENRINEHWKIYAPEKLKKIEVQDSLEA